MARKSAAGKPLSAAETGGKNRRDRRWFAPLIRVLRKAYKAKCAAELVVITGRHQRKCESWLAGDSVPDGAALAALLRSEHGDKLHLALIQGVTFTWAADARVNHEISQADRDLAAAVARRTAALKKRRGDE